MEGSTPRGDEGRPPRDSIRQCATSTTNNERQIQHQNSVPPPQQPQQQPQREGAIASATSTTNRSQAGNGSNNGGGNNGGHHPSGRKRSRWGDLGEEGRGPSAPSSSNGMRTDGSTQMDVTVSDQEALDALLASAEPKVERYGGRKPNHHPANDNNHKRPPRRDDTEDHHRGNNRGGDRNDHRRSENNNNNNRKNGPDYSYYNGRGGNENNDRKRRSERQEHGKADNDEEATKNEREDVAGEEEEEEEEAVAKQKPNFGLSGALAQEQVGELKFREPPEARAPNTQWRFYVFKDDKALETLHISRQSAYLFGRNPELADIPILHPSASGQHAVLQYRALPGKEDGRLRCMPYLMDLESTNGSFINGVRIDPARYYQLKKGDVLKFGASTREYVLLTENTTSVK